MRRILLAFLLLLWPATACATAVAGVLRVIPTTDGVTVRLALSEPLPSPPRAFALADPMRWAVDLEGASSLRRDTAGSGDIRAARVSQFDPRTVRLVLDLAQPMQLVSARQEGGQTIELRFRPIDEAGFRRLVGRGRNPVPGFQQQAPKPPTDLAADSAARLDAVEAALALAEQDLSPPAAIQARPPIDPRAGLAPQPAIDPRLPPAPAATAPAREAPVPSPRPARRRTAVIVIDPGHGGHDPGASSGSGEREKDVTLAIAKLTRSAIERRAKAEGVPVQVRLTRDTDSYVTLGNRVRLARSWKADLFISIHADAAPNVLARGASVYTLSEVASDREAARVAAKENRSDLIAGIDLSREPPEVASILVDLGMRDSMNASADFAQNLQRGLEPKGVLFRSQFHRFANFQVLRNLGVPAVLLETGYLSNADDAGYLSSSRGQKALADGIAIATVDYFGGR